jgi:S1-C subfamily serine protease
VERGYSDRHTAITPDIDMNELLKQCYHILSIHEGASRELIDKAYGVLKEFYEERAAHIEAGDGLEAWEQLKKIAWARDTLLEHLPENEPVPPGADQKETSAEQKRTEQRKPITDTTKAKEAGRKGPWWLSSVFVVAAVLLFSVLFYYYQSKHPSQAKTSNGTSWSQDSQPIGSLSGAVEPGTSDAFVGLPELLQEVKRAVVTLQFGKWVGSGFLVSDDGYIVTNAHVVNGIRGTAQLAEGEPVEVNLVTMEPEKDFALLKTASGNAYTFLRLGDSNSCREGDTVIAVGSPYNLQLSFTKGIVSAKNRRDPRLSVSLIQTDAAINHGNSGGPLIDQTGKVIGINTEGFHKEMAEGLNFAIAINDVKSLIKEGQAVSDAERTRDASRLEAGLQQQQQKREERAQETREQIARVQQQENSRYKDQLDQIKQRLETAKKRQVLQTCFNEANKKVEDQWDEECRSLSRPFRCRLPANIGNRLQGSYLEAQSDCIKYYGE